MACFAGLCVRLVGVATWDCVVVVPLGDCVFYSVVLSGVVVGPKRVRVGGLVLPT